MNKNNLIIRLIELYYFPRDQYMGPYIFIHICFYYEKKSDTTSMPPNKHAFDLFGPWM
jgi:hypothetical protein